MDFSENNYQIVFTKIFYYEMEKIYLYIAYDLYAPKPAKKLIYQVYEGTQKLSYMPRRYAVIKRRIQSKIEYRKIVVKNYLIVYSIDEENYKVNIIHMFYVRNNYLNKL